MKFRPKLYKLQYYFTPWVYKVVKVYSVGFQTLIIIVRYFREVTYILNTDSVLEGQK